MTIDAMNEALEALVQTMPEALFEDLNGGVNLCEDAWQDENGQYMLSAYKRERTLGRWIEIYYGSFRELYPQAAEQQLLTLLEGELRKQLRRHMDELAGIYHETEKMD